MPKEYFYRIEANNQGQNTRVNLETPSLLASSISASPIEARPINTNFKVK
ncbi:MAG: hypothetical protein WC503_05030 [Candidatus Shapirobacteria bacterium]